MSGYANFSRSWRSRGIMLGLAASILALGLTLVPGEARYTAFLISDGAFDRLDLPDLPAAATLPDKTIWLENQFQLARRNGDIGRATEALEALAQDSPGDPAMRARLSRHYLDYHDVSQYLGVFKRDPIETLTPRETEQVLALLRYRGEYIEERALLDRLVSKGDATPDQMARLAALELHDGEVESAIALLRKVDRAMDLSRRPERLILFENLVAEAHYDEAVERAQRWLSNWKDPGVAAYLSRLLELKEKFDLAEELAGSRVNLSAATLGDKTGVSASGRGGANGQSS